MATLYVKTPNGTQYSIDLTKINSGGGSAAANGYALMNNGCMLQWGRKTSTTDSYVNFPVTFSSVYAIAAVGNSTAYDTRVTELSTSKATFHAANNQIWYLVVGK